MPRLKNAVIVVDNYGDNCLLGEVYDDPRYKGDNGINIKDGNPTGSFKNGNHIVTSKIEKFENMICTTISGTVYLVENLMSKAEAINHINAVYEEIPEYRDYIKSKIK